MEIGLINYERWYGMAQFSTKVLQISILDIDDWDRIRVNIQKKIQL